MVPNNFKAGKKIIVSDTLNINGKPLATASIIVSIGDKTYEVTTSTVGRWNLSYTPKKA